MANAKEMTALPDFAPKSTTPPCLAKFPKKSRHYKS